VADEVFREVFQRLIASLGEELDASQLVSDEHVRHQFYKDVIDSLERAADIRDLVDALSRDPDTVMASAAATYLVDSVARRNDRISDFASWGQLAGRLLEEFEFPRKRFGEWLVYKRIQSGDADAIREALRGSDWLQKKLAAECAELPVLEMLAEEGRTKRIRSLASQGLKKRRALDR
jgi:hypothetical protein